MANIKNRTQYINENYNRPNISDSRRNKSDYDRLRDQATQDVVKHRAQNMGGFPEGEMNKFIEFITSECAGSIVTLGAIEEIVKKFLRVSMENDASTAKSTGNFSITKAISQLIYDEMKERNLLDLSNEESYDDVDEFDEDLDFNEDDEVDGFQDNDEIRESVKRKKPIIRNRRK